MANGGSPAQPLGSADSHPSAELKKMLHAQIVGWGMYVPSRVVANDSFVKMGLDTSNEWIESRTGIEERRLVGKNEATSDLAVKASLQALHTAGAHAADIDLIIVATCTPDHVMPSTASLVQTRLGATRAGAMDLNAACSGFVYALATGAGQIESGRAKQVLVVGADELSIHLDWKDRNTCVLFGDGAGAVLLRASQEAGVLSSAMGSDGSGADLLIIPAGGSRIRTNHNGKSNGKANGDQYLKMNGPQIFRWATQMMAKTSEDVMAASGLKPEQVDLFIPHQANLRIIEATAKRVGIPSQKVFSNVGHYGNTSAASIPIALCEAIVAGRVKRGDNILLSSFGAGLSWAALALRWGVNVQAQPTPWSPLRLRIETRMAALRSTLRKQNRRVRTSIDSTLHRDQD